MECPSCFKKFTSKQSLLYHITHMVCQKQINKCDICGVIFSNKSALLYHNKNNVCEKKQESLPQITLKKKKKITIKGKYQNMTKEELLTKVAQLEGKVEALTEYPNTVNNQINLIFPKAFGTEDMKHISKKMGDILGPLIKNHPFKSIPCLFNKIHNNEQMPEYHNVYISGERSNYAMVSDGKTFTYEPRKTVIDQIIETKRSLLNKYVDDNGEQLGEKVLKKYEKYQERIDDDSEFRKDLEIEIGGLLLNMKSVIANDDKTRKLLDQVTEGHFELSQGELQSP